MGRLFILVGIFLIVLGALFHFGWMGKIGKLPGDIIIHRENFTLFFPITTSLLISLIVSIVLFFFRK